MSFPYNIVNHGDNVNVTAFIEGRMYVANSEHPAISDIVTLVAEGDEDVVHLFDATSTIQRGISDYTDRIVLRDNVVYFDGEVVDNTITHAILRIARTGAPYEGLVNFLGRIANNPSQHSREQLFDWLRDRDFTITRDGCFIAYKGVGSDGRSIHAGPAVVDGKPMNGRIPNEVGSVITMAREKVQHDSHIGCSVGLHVGTWDYASTFGGGNTLKVKVDPSDVVSVPTDCNAQKMRVCRYEVLSVTTKPVDDVYDDLDDLLSQADEAYNNVDDETEWYALDSRVFQASDGFNEWQVVVEESEFGDLRAYCDCPSYRHSRVGSCKHADLVLAGWE